MNYTTPKQVKTTFSNLFCDSNVSAKNMASLPFPYAIGEKRKDADISVPMGMRFDFVPVPEFSVNANSALNRAARAYYNYVTQGFTSTQTSFEASDLMVYQISVAYLIMKMLEIKREYKILKKYSPFNKDLARRVSTVLGYDYDDWTRNFANIRAEYNILVAQINQALHIMPDFKLITYWSKLVSSVYTDSMTEKFQVYAFVPCVWGRYSATASTGGSSIQPVYYRSDSAPRSVETAFGEVRELLSALINDSDINNLSGVVLRVYKDKSASYLSELSEGEELSFEYDPATLKQIHNLNAVGITHFVGRTGSNTNFIVNQSNNELVCLMQARRSENGYQACDIAVQSEHCVDFPYENPSAEEVLEATSMSTSGGLISPSGSKFLALRFCGAVVETFSIYGVGADGEFEQTQGFSTYLMVAEQGIRSSFVTDAERYSLLVAKLSNFDWHPIVYTFKPTMNGATVIGAERASYPIGDVNNFTFVSADFLDSLHDRTAYYMTTAAPNLAGTTK